ncbi:MAG: dihydropteroate synthase [Acidobacteria bacterium]|nr:dihydropteroate synthase [Acidobacteriota bacterium]
MGVLNVTPDSFSDGGRFLALDHAVGHAVEMVESGADIIDVGGESTRPGSGGVSEQEELERVAPVIEQIVREIAKPVSIDTTKPAVAAEALRKGARIINDVTAFGHPEMLPLAARTGAAAVLMHMRGTPETMQRDVAYDDVVADIKAFLAERLAAAREAGLTDLAVDPGIGFGKTAAHNFEILRRLGEFAELGAPILVGPSRKSFLSALPSRPPTDKRLPGTIAACCAAVLHGAGLVRVHDVRECRLALEVIDAVRSA